MFPGRVIATALRNPDFAAYARAFGGHGETVEETAEFLPAFERALASGLPSILHVKIDPEAITPATTLVRHPRAGAGEGRPKARRPRDRRALRPSRGGSGGVWLRQGMTKLFERAADVLVRGLPPETQDALARIVRAACSKRTTCRQSA